MLSWISGGSDVNALIAKKSYKKAIRLLEAHLVENPKSVHTRQLLADVLGRAGQTERAVEILYGLVDEFTEEGFVAKAIAVLKKIQRVDPNKAQLNERLESLVRQRDERLIGLVPESEQPTKQAKARPPRPKEPPATLTSELRIGDLWFEDAAEHRDDFHWSPLFNNLSKLELAALVGSLELLVKKPGAIIYSEGEPGSSLFVLTTGTTRVYRRDETGHNHQVALMRDGDFFGKSSVLFGHPRSTTVTAATECELLELGRETFEAISESYPRVRQLVEEFQSRF